MEPGALIVAALSLGTAAGIGSVAEQTVKDLYAGLKKLIQDRYPSVELRNLEQEPDSEVRRDDVETTITAVGADQDNEVLSRAAKLIEAVYNLPAETKPAIGVNIAGIRAASLTLRNITASGTGVELKSSEFQGDIRIEDVRAGETDSNHPKV